MKKIITFLFATILIFSNSVTFVYADNAKEGSMETETISVTVEETSLDNIASPNDALETTSNSSGDESYVANSGFEEAGDVYVESEETTLIDSVSPEGALEATGEDIAEAEQETDDISSLDEVTSSTASWIYLSDYLVYNQTKSYYCGPACVQAVLRYLNGSSPSQSTVATSCSTTTSGTYLSNMKTYINSKQSVRTYVIKYNASLSTMKKCLYKDIVTYDVPSIIGLSFSASDGWLYSSNGHFMTVYGTKSDKSSFALGDPWIKYSGSGLSSNSSSYSKSASILYAAYSNKNIGLMY